MLFRKNLEMETMRNEFIDLTDDIEKVVEESGLKEGICNIFIPGTTAGFVMNENEKMLIEDFRRFFNKMVPYDKPYSHPSNAFSHIRANLVSTEKTIPVSKGKLVLGTWQSIMLWEFDIKSRKRKIVVTVTGDKEKPKRASDLQYEEYQSLSEM